MDVHLTPDQESFIRQAIATGRLHSAEEAVKQAVGLWEERERERSELLATLDEARDSIARGEAIPITQDSMRALAEDVKQLGRARCAAERQPPV